MRNNQTPSAFMFEDIHAHTGLSNRAVAEILLSSRPIYAGRSPRDRIGERTFLSREVVHVTPDRVNPALYADFSHSAQTLTAHIVAAYGHGSAAYNKTVEHYGGSAAQQMAEIIYSFGYDWRIYANTVKRILTMHLPREADRAVLVVMSFLATGCLVDPRAAADVVLQFSKRKLSRDLATIESAPKLRAQQTLFDSQDDVLGLVRVINGAVRPPIYQLSAEAKGTMIGSLPIEGSCITDVEVDVSRQHLIIWRQYERWWCQGLGSTNGTFVIRSGTKELVTVEAPRASRLPNEKSAPVEICEGDTICLGRRTRFLVMRMSG